jgi:hypothetical protein
MDLFDAFSGLSLFWPLSWVSFFECVPKGQLFPFHFAAGSVKEVQYSPEGNSRVLLHPLH